MPGLQNRGWGSYLLLAHTHSNTFLDHWNRLRRTLPAQERKPTHVRTFACAYVCFSTKAVFFNLVSDLSTEAFLASLRCFSAIYGAPHEIHSDKGSNFVGADKEYDNYYTSFCRAMRLNTHRSLSWHFSRSQAPHFRGPWESAVKAMKMLLKKVAGYQVLSPPSSMKLLPRSSQGY